jgi:MFS family permease
MLFRPLHANRTFLQHRMSSLLIPLGGTVAAQAAAAMLLFALPVLGPVLTEMLGIAPERIGLLTAASSFGTVWFMTVSRLFLDRFGPIRSLQIGLAAAGLALLSLLISPWPLILLPALLLGAGYAPNAPASSVILARVSTPRQTPLVFSIKQAAVPLGGVASGLLIPFLLGRGGVGPALAVLAAGALLVALLVQPLRRRFDAIADPRAPFGLRALVRPANVVDMARAIGGNAELRLLTLTGIAFSVMQSAVFGFLVTHLVGVGLAYATAGLCFSVMATAGVIGRLAIGWLASASGKPRLTLAALGLAGFLIALVAASLSVAWPVWALMLASALAGIAAGSWNGIYLGEIARAAPEREVGQATAGSTFFVFIGYTCGPAVFGGLVTLTGGYATPYVLAGLGVLAAGITLARRVAASQAGATAAD